MKILISDASFDIAGSEFLGELRRCGFEIIRNPYGPKLSAEDLGKLLVPGVVAMIAGTERITQEAIEKAPDLRVISRCGTGIDSIDMTAAAKASVHVVRTADATTDAVAELTVGLILSLLHGLTDNLSRVGGRTNGIPVSLTTSTVGVVGYGRIGKNVAERVSAFGATVLACNSKTLDAKTESKIGEGILLTSLDEIIQRADIITLHVPLNQQTNGMFDLRRLKNMRRGSMLVNTSRGALIVEGDLYNVLESGHLAGAAIDTFSDEPYSGPLINLDNVILTPHVGSRTEETRAKMERDAAKNLFETMKELDLF